MLNTLRDEIHENAKNHGWWDKEPSFGEIIALCHSELSEALEEYRHGGTDTYFRCSENCGDCDSENFDGVVDCFGGDVEEAKANLKPEGIPIELADCIIRILDYCGHAGIDIEEAIKIKHEYNKTRSYRHGGKVM